MELLFLCTGLLLGLCVGFFGCLSWYVPFKAPPAQITKDEIAELIAEGIRKGSVQ